jgi:adenosylhomocysteine nucleosidase
MRPEVPKLQKRLALMGAMQEELAAILACMPDAHCQRVAGREFWLGHFEGHDVVAVLSGIGKVAAALTATVLIDKFQVHSIVFTGVAGGLAAQAKVGDVVVANALLQHDMDASPLFPPYVVPLTGCAQFPSDANITQCLVRSARQALPHVTVHAASRQLQTDLPEAMAVEMEGAALAQVCRDFGVPLGVVRTISDRADDDAHTDFSKFVQDVASHYSVAIVSAFLKQFPKS